MRYEPRHAVWGRGARPALIVRCVVKQARMGDGLTDRRDEDVANLCRIRRWIGRGSRDFLGRGQESDDRHIALAPAPKEMPQQLLTPLLKPPGSPCAHLDHGSRRHNVEAGMQRRREPATVCIRCVVKAQSPKSFEGLKNRLRIQVFPPAFSVEVCPAHNPSRYRSSMFGHTNPTPLTWSAQPTTSFYRLR